jgi:hypothetical protein
VFDDSLVDCGDGTCVTDTSECANCANTFTVSGSADLDGDGNSDDCYTDGSGYFVFDCQTSTLPIKDKVTATISVTIITIAITIKVS